VKGYLDAYVRLLAKIDAIDRYVGEHGILDSDGEPRGCLRLYTSRVNSARLALARLEGRVQARQVDPVQELNDYLASKREACG
jgi:hypothetical protein